jgi:phosphoglycerol transferase
MLKLLGLATPEFGAAFNLYYLLGFPLAAMTCLFALRRFQVSYPSAIAAALLYAFTHYHFFRGEEHLFLASYYVVPLSVMVVLWVYLGRLTWPFQHASPDEPGAPGRFWGSLAIALVQASAGVYYAFFACYLLLVAGGGAALRQRSLRSLAPAAALIAVTSFGGLANMAPNLLYRYRHGANPEVAKRDLNDAEIHSLKIGQMLLPAPRHRLAKWAHARQKYDATPLSAGEKQGCALGLIGSAGFLFLLGALLRSRGRSGEPQLIDGLAALNVFSLLLAVNGGFGTLIALLVSPQLRGYNRISIYIALFALFAAALGCDRLLAWQAKRGRTRWPLHLALAAVVALGIVDQSGRGRVPDYAGLKARFVNDAEFVARIEAALAPGDMVFQLPYFPFPEHPPVGGVECYDLARPYLHSHGLHWSYAAMKGREVDLWQREVQAKPAGELVSALAAKGFRGIYIDRQGYADRGAELESRLEALLGAPPLKSGDDRLSFFALGAARR